MSSIEVSTQIAASPMRVFAELARIEDHVEWMADAVAIEFHTEQRRGTGTTFSCATKVGPLRTTDEMVVTTWEDDVAIGVDHRGAFEGRGEFRLSEGDDGRTQVTWREELRFPLWMGAGLGARIAAPILRRIWAKNLDRLRHRVEDPANGDAPTS
jgi:Polyketide cyclase / dehydrase and lipid transport